MLIVEDDSFVRAMIATAARHHGFHVVASVGTANDAMLTVRHGGVDTAVLDLDLGGGPTGIDLAIGMRRIRPDIGIVFLTSYTDPRLLDTRLTSLPRQCAYVVKHSLEDTQILAAAIEGSRHATATPRVDLTDAQIETLRLLAAGLSNAEIARIRVVDVSAVEKVLQRTATALGVTSSPGMNQRVSLARAYYRMAGLPDAPA